jgi:hypothetical protein
MPGTMDGVVLARTVRSEFPVIKIMLTSANLTRGLHFCMPTLAFGFEAGSVVHPRSAMSIERISVWGALQERELLRQDWCSLQ